MHSYNENTPWPHWDELHLAHNYIIRNVKTYSGCRLISKEKWGSLRYEWILPPGGRLFNVHSIRMPFMSCDIQIEERKIKFTYYLGKKGKLPVILWRWCDSWLYGLWEQIGWWTLKKVVHRAVKKFPNVKHEIMADLEWS